jgi:Fe-S oxidoreductase
MDMEVLEPLYELRAKCVEDGNTHPALDKVMGNLRSQGTMVVNASVKKGQWAEGLGVKNYLDQKVDVIYHAGCRTALDETLWGNARKTIALLNKAGIEVGIAGEHELCCGGRAYQTGYQSAFLQQAQANAALFKKSGAKLLVTGCAECYQAFKVLYAKFKMKPEMEILHIAEYLDRLIKQGQLVPKKPVAAKITYQDPCYLGRLGEPYIPWEGRQLPGHIRLFEPSREFRRGTYGVYEPPRNVLRSIPGLQLVEMERIKEYAWCCGAGGGVKETNPEFAAWTAQARISEAEETGAEAVVTACPGCEKNFKDTLKSGGSGLKVYDIVELLESAI